ncbi:MAG: TonB-dependent receptor [Sphingomicrobium sp.]
MNHYSRRSAILLGAAVVLAQPASAQDRQELIVTATRVPVSAQTIPQSETIISWQSLRDRGAVDLRSALAPAAGVEALPSGDSGPAGAVLALHGLAEMDAYLLVVDGVPAGGAFNPATASFDPIDLDRIEIVRGAAPVTFGATSFVGVVHAIHAAAGTQATRGWAEVGTRRSGRLAFATRLFSGGIGQSLLASAETRDDAQNRAGFRRAHLLYRAAAPLAGGRVHLDLDGILLDQTPNSPHPLEDGELSDRFPTNANVNPSDARQDQRRGQINLGFDRALGALEWSTTASFARTIYHNTRGFLRDEFAEEGVTVNADGYRQRVATSDLYLDSHVGAKGRLLDWVVGADWLHGAGEQRSANFEYPVLPDGSNAPSSFSRTTDESTRVEDRRSFSGIYAEAVLKPTTALTLLGGIRLNRTVEHRCASEGEGTSLGDEEDCGRLARTRLAGSIGASFAVRRHGRDGITAFANYRDTYKPAAIDFGPEAEGDILRPETAHGWEAGIRGSAGDGRLTVEASVFSTRFANLVIRENVGGLPALANAGSERLRGFEIEGHWQLTPAASVDASFAHHLARFTDYELQGEDGDIDQLAGNRLALSPKNVASAIVTLASAVGPQASATLRYVGPRFLDKENEARAGAYATIDARIGWRFGSGLGLYVRGENLTDRRDPISESELGDAQFYRLPSRRILASLEIALNH